MECRRLLTVGITTLLRGHVGDSAMYARRAIESMCFAVHAWTDEGAAEAWLNFLKSKTASKKYRSKFQIMSLLAEWKENFHQGPQVYKLYDWLSNQVHPTYSSIMFAQRQEGEDHGETSFNLSFFDAENGPHLLAVMYFEILRTHLSILSCVAELVISNDSTYAEELFFAFMQSTNTEYFMQRERWQNSWNTIGAPAPPNIHRGALNQTDRLVANLKLLEEESKAKSGKTSKTRN